MTAVPRVFQRADRQSMLMRDMMDRLGLSPVGAGRITLGIPLRMAFRNCHSCGRSEDCQAWLSRHQTAIEAPDFCPNASFFRRIRATGEASLRQRTAEDFGPGRIPG